MAASRGVLITTLVFRILAVGLLAGSVVLLVTDKFRDPIDGTKTTFRDVQGYRYVVAATVFGFFYTLFQIPFAFYHVVKEKRLIRHECLPQFDFYADKLVAFILATAVGVGFGITFEFKKFLHEFEKAFGDGDDDSISQPEKFLDKANIAIGLLFLGFLCVAVQSVISSMSRTSSSGRSFFR